MFYYWKGVLRRMNIHAYEKAARATALYGVTNPGARFIYPALGLAGEIGESLDKIFASPVEASPAVMTEDVVKELGDVLWYVVNTGLDANISLGDLVDLVTGGIRADTFEEVAFGRLRHADKRSPYLRLTIHAGQIAEIAKKAIRDSGGFVPSEKRLKIAVALSEIFVAWLEVCERNGVSPNHVAVENRIKLESRALRGKLKGDGDNR